MDTAPVILWLRKDLRLDDHPALTAAVRSGRPIVPVFIRDASIDALGAAPKWRLGEGLARLQDSLSERASRLILRSGPALDVLCDLAAETGAASVYWSRLYDPEARDRDAAIKSALPKRGVEARSFPGQLLLEPWNVAPKSGGHFKVYTAFWRQVRGRDMGAPEAAPRNLRPPRDWPESESLPNWRLAEAMSRGAAIVARHARTGEAAALDRLRDFVETSLADYAEARDIPGADGTSRLSAHLALGEISPRRCWSAAMSAFHQGNAGAEIFLKELVWREFGHHLMYHAPRILTRNWREEWDSFPWNEDAGRADVRAWQRGRTGVPMVDAAMREMHVTGTMHNRGRMIAASFLTKHLLSHWRIGQRYFEDHLVDWDPASNALGWQWCAGSGPDAAPYFRIFNPERQADRFDPDETYVRRWIAEGRPEPPQTALDYFQAIPRRWNLSAEDAYPDPSVDLAEGRRRALAAYETRDF